jgi:Holliday junction resolvase RusA-like endonuclease
VHKIDIKPLSVNQAWVGKLRKTNKLTKYNRDINLILPKASIPDGNLKLSIVFGFSSKASDIDNPLKPFIDCLQNRYGFDDKNIYELNVKKEVVKRGCEYIEFDIQSI